MRAARHVVDWSFGTTVEEQVGKHDKPDEDTVTVHVTPRGGFFRGHAPRSHPLRDREHAHARREREWH